MDYLQSLPQGTFGREYADWLRVNVRNRSVYLSIKAALSVVTVLLHTTVSYTILRKLKKNPILPF